MSSSWEMTVDTEHMPGIERAHITEMYLLTGWIGSEEGEEGIEDDL